MVRSTVAPGPFEGERVLDRDGHGIGTLRALNVTGQRVQSLTIETDDGRLVDVPRDWFAETTREGVLLTEERARILDASAAGSNAKP